MYIYIYKFFFSNIAYSIDIVLSIYYKYSIEVFNLRSIGLQNNDAIKIKFDNKSLKRTIERKWDAKTRIDTF